MHDTTHKSVAVLARFDRMLRLIVLLQTENEYMIQRCWLRIAENSRMRGRAAAHGGTLAYELLKSPPVQF